MYKTEILSLQLLKQSLLEQKQYETEREVEISMPKNANVGNEPSVLSSGQLFYLNIAKPVFSELSEEFANFFLSSSTRS